MVDLVQYDSVYQEYWYLGFQGHIDFSDTYRTGISAHCITSHPTLFPGKCVHFYWVLDCRTAVLCAVYHYRSFYCKCSMKSMTTNYH